MNIVFQALMTIEGMSKRRAENIALSLINKARALIQNERRIQLGIKSAIWKYSGALCGSDEQNSDHKAADGQCYLIAEGMLLNGHWTWPGCDAGCRCISKAIIPELEAKHVKYKGAVK